MRLKRWTWPRNKPTNTTSKETRKNLKAQMMKKRRKLINFKLLAKRLNSKMNDRGTLSKWQLSSRGSSRTNQMKKTRRRTAKAATGIHTMIMMICRGRKTMKLKIFTCGTSQCHQCSARSFLLKTARMFATTLSSVECTVHSRASSSHWESGICKSSRFRR